MNRLKMKRVLCTGANGFIGKHLVKKLKSLGAKVITLDRKKCDVTDETQVLQSIKKHKPEIIYHLAASLGKQYEDVGSTLNINLIGTLNILKSANEVDSVKNIILMGSSDDYNTHSIYGVTKKVVSELGFLYSRVANYSVVTLKPFIVYGPGQKNKAFIPSMMKAHIENQMFYMSEGKQKRDFVYIDDVVDSIIFATYMSDTYISGEIIEIGTGKGTPIVELAEMMRQRFNLKYLATGVMRSGELMEHVADTKKAKELLGWEAKVNIEEGLKKTLKWWEDGNRQIKRIL